MIKNLVVIVCLFFSMVTQANQTFFEEIKKMREKNLSLQSTEQRLKAMGDNATAKKFFWMPTLTLSGGRQKIAHNQALADGQTSAYWKASSSWSLFNGGADFYGKRAADFQEQAESYNYQNDQLKTDAQLASIIFQQLYLNDVIESTQNLVKLREESHRIVIEKFKVGKVPYQEVEKSDIDKNQQEIRLRNLKIENLNNQTQWRALFGEEMQTDKWPFHTGTISTNFFEAKITSASYSVAPELGKLENLSLAYEGYWKSAKSDYWPRLDFVVDYQNDLVANNNNISNRVWTGGLYLTIPLWNKYETAAKVGSAYADFVAARNQFEISRNLSRVKKNSMVEKIELTRKNLEDAKASLQKSEKLYEDMLTSFRFGRISVNELLIEQNRLIDSQMGLSQSEWDYHKIILDACSDLGEQIETCIR
jgi:outer membrane protein TolC